MDPCPVCRAELASPRCDSCGAAASPGGFRVEALLSQTLHGRVYRARSPDGAEVALKELVFALAPDAQTIDAFEREARVLSQLDHPAIPRFKGAFREGIGIHLRLYLAQELVEGEPLSQRLRRGPLPKDEVRTLARQALNVLAYLHERRVLHRDVKPANLIVKPDGSISLVDFGVARELLKEVTHGGTLVGTFGYMPIEQLGGTVDARSDLYALGATLLHCVTGIQPGDLIREDFSLDASRAGDLRGWLERMTALRREDRYASAEKALAALDQKPEPLKPPWRIRWRMFWSRFAQPRTPMWPEVVRLPAPRDRITL
ncbi:MAG: serine/threonine protein kinase [Myxococcales bacterium]|nr:serine/threonine protein kinase [Myxococcales bacterium]